MGKDAGEARDLKKLRHDRRRARQRAKRGEVLPLRREGGVIDPTPHIASLAIITDGRYLTLGNGFVVRARY
jgi:hypothetical protein